MPAQAISEKRRVTLNTLANGTAQFAGIAAGFVLMPLLVRNFGMRDYGLYMIAQSIVGYAALLDMGVGTSVVKLIAERSARDDHKGSSSVASAGLAFYIGVGVLFAVLVLVVGFNAQSVFRIDTAGAALLKNLTIVAALASLLSWPLATATFVLQGHQRFTVTARTAVVVVLANVTVTAFVLYMGQGPLALFAATSLVNVAGGILNAAQARRIAGHLQVNPFRADYRSFKSIFGISWALFIIQICTLVIYQQTDRLILGVFVGAASVTLYEAASKFQSLVVQLTGFSNSAVMPLASSLQSEGRSATLQTLFVRGTKYSLALVLPVVVVLMVLARPLLTTWMGPAFGAEALAAQLFLVHQLLTPSTAVGDAALAGLGRVHKRVPYVVWILTAGNLLVSLLLVRRLGILAVVLGTTLPHIIEYPFHLRLLLRELDVPARRFFGQVALRVYPPLLVPLGLSVFLVGTQLATTLGGVGTIAALSIGSYWLTFFVIGLDKAERIEAIRLVEALRRPRVGTS
jgi:O-antigen/teichoic acid export membrane protein